MRFRDCQLLFTKITSIYATTSSSASAPSLLLSTLRVLSHAHWALGWRSQTLILLWRGWSRQQAALKPSAPSVWSLQPWIEAPWTTQCSRPSYKHSSGFLSARRPSQYISELLFLSYDHIIPAAPCDSSHALHTLETLDACFPSGGSGLDGPPGSLNIYYFSPHCHSLVLVQSLKTLSNWSSLLTLVHQLITLKHA